MRPSDRYLQWYARSYFFEKSIDYYYEKIRRLHSRFFFFDNQVIRMSLIMKLLVGLEQRKTNLTQMELMLYILLENSPSRFLSEAKPEFYLLVNKHKDLKEISSFLQNTMYPPLEGIVVVWKQTKDDL